MKVKSFEESLFCQKYVLIESKIPELKKYVKKFYCVDLNISDKINGYTSIFEKDGSDFILIFILNDSDCSIYAHEFLHAVNFCLERKGVRPSFKNDETQAYLLQRLFNEFYL